MKRLPVPNHYEQHFLRMPADRWPEPVTRAMSRINNDIFTPMQGPSEAVVVPRLRVQGTPSHHRRLLQ